MNTELTQPIKWHGGKHYLAKRIIELMPPHVHYVEPYFGGGSVLLQKNPEGVSEVVNDINHELANFWTVIRNEVLFPDFQRIVGLTPFSQEFFDMTQRARRSMFANEIDNTDNPEMIDAAWMFFVSARQSRQGLMNDFATLSRNRTRRGMNEQVSSWLTAVEGLPEIHERMKRVVILNGEATKVIEQQDGENTLFYCDPPYLHETRISTDAYEKEMSDQEHAHLLLTLDSIKGKFILSGYHSRLYDNHAKTRGWHLVEILIDNKASSKAVKEKKIECLWMNYEPAGGVS